MRVQPKDPSTKITIEAYKGLETHNTSPTNVQYIRLIKLTTGGYIKMQVYVITYRAAAELNTRLTELEEKLSEV